MALEADEDVEVESGLKHYFRPLHTIQMSNPSQDETRYGFFLHKATRKNSKYISYTGLSHVPS